MKITIFDCPVIIINNLTQIICPLILSTRYPLNFNVNLIFFWRSETCRAPRYASAPSYDQNEQSKELLAQDEIACFRISETWRTHAAPWFCYIYVLRKRENSNLRDSVTSPERKCQVTFPSYLSQQISAVVRFRHVSANGSAVVCYIYQSTNARWFFEQQ